MHNIDSMYDSLIESESLLSSLEEISKNSALLTSLECNREETKRTVQSCSQSRIYEIFKTKMSFQTSHSEHTKKYTEFFRQ